MKYLDDTGLSLLWSKMKGLIPSSLPANGGNADTVDGKHYSDILCGSIKSAKMYVDNDTHIAKLGYFDLSKGEYSSTALMVGNGFWGNQHNCCELIIIGSDLYGVDDDGVAKFTISKIHLGGSYERTLYYKVNGKKVEIYVACYGGNGYGKWFSKVIGSNESNLWYADFVENCSSADLTEIGYAGVFGSATKLANARTIAIGNTGKFFDGSGDVSWSLSEIGALPLTGGTLTGGLTVTGETVFTGDINSPQCSATFCNIVATGYTNTLGDANISNAQIETLNVTKDVTFASTILAKFGGLEAGYLVATGDNYHDYTAYFADTNAYDYGSGKLAISVKGKSKLDGELSVTGATTLSSTLNVTGATTLASTLSVAGKGTFNESLYLFCDSHCYFYGNKTGFCFNAAVIIQSAFAVTYWTRLASLKVTGSTGLGTDYDSAYRLKVSGDTYMDGKLTVTGDVALSSTLKVTGDTTLAANLSVGGSVNTYTITHEEGAEMFIGNDGNTNYVAFVEDLEGYDRDNEESTWQLSTAGNLSNLASVSATNATIGTLTLTSGLKIQASSTKTYTFNMAKAISLGLIS